MRGPWRAALALALHIGFFALPSALVVGLFGIAALAYRYEPDNGLRAGLATAVVAGLIGLGMRTVLRIPTRPRGTSVGRSTQPQLWSTVERIADTAGVAEPDQIRIVSEPGVNVREDTVLLGLHPRKRYLEIGLPLIAGLSVSELRALLAHELGRTGAGSKLKAAVHRTTTGVERTAAGMIGGPTKWLFTGYVRLYTAVTAPIMRDLESSGDTVAAQLEGKRVTTTALRKVTGIELGWRDYSREYLSMAVAVARTPDLLLGFRAFLEHPDRSKELAERAKQAISDENAHGDHERTSGLTVGQRIQALKRLADRDDEPDDRPAMALVREPRRTIPALEDRLMVDGLGTRVPWPELGRMAGAAEAAHQAARLSASVLHSGVSSDTTVAGVLACLHQGQGADLINPVLDPGLNPDEVDQAVIDTITELLGAAVVDALVCAGHAHHELDWGGPCQVRLAHGQLLDPDRLVRPAVVDPRLIPGLHRHLVHLGVPLDHSRPAAEEPDAVLAGIVSPVRYSSRLHDLLVTDRGLLFVPSASGLVSSLLAGALTLVRRKENRQLEKLESTPIAELRERADAQWVDSRDIATARLSQRGAGWMLSLELYLDDYAVSKIDPAGTVPGDDDLALLEVHSTPDSGARGAPYGGLDRVMGARMRVEDQQTRDE
ncbi:Zn-dependent protease with chaperone function [Halopolyspora algeriensis]|uniref:Zn-dependent protease with chaperone function n=1 Tax=Halopolyspora algeriensis TaxID=1500506 RepID=A0A368VPY4_9ACTN|nr:M48 family metallopeptidase [Halopolyspora algeriensis]RCW43564.1 Zn-dependent protease with chaperone function [Halopolyspora algeriensis]TQM47651.1 Zn-dependent protease with chaperone function [Halopolyspora algeriensis]